MVYFQIGGEIKVYAAPLAVRLFEREGDERVEIINDEAFMMVTLSRIYQEIGGEIFRQLANFLEEWTGMRIVA